jgi:CxxC motif-containing protein
MFEAMRLLGTVELSAPIEEGQIVVEDICGTGIPFVTTRSIKQGR